MKHRGALSLLLISAFAILLMVNGKRITTAVLHPNLNADFLNAADRNKPREVIDLLERGANVNHRGAQHGLTALHAAASHGNDAMVATLLDRGARIDAASEGGLTPLHNAVGRCNPSTVQLLLRRGANPLLRTQKFNRTPRDDAEGRAGYYRNRSVARNRLQEAARYGSIAAALKAAEARHRARRR